MITISLLLLVLALLATLASAATPSRLPLWVAVLLLCLWGLLTVLPLGT